MDFSLGDGRDWSLVLGIGLWIAVYYWSLDSGSVSKFSHGNGQDRSLVLIWDRSPDRSLGDG